MNNKNYQGIEYCLHIYKIWAPEDSIWTEWVKPVLFADTSNKMNVDLDIKKVNWISKADRGTAIIVDLPGKSGVDESLSLAKLGFRPIPLYNGVNAPMNYPMQVYVRDIVSALFQGADILETLNLSNDAPPVFMLDSERMNGISKVGIYDNRWCILPQDMPSASFLLEQGITQIILRSDTVRDDLSHILCRYHEQGLKIAMPDKNLALKEITPKKPSRFRSLMYRFQVIAGLRRNAAGGFGEMLPDPIQNTTTHHHRYG